MDQQDKVVIAVLQLINKMGIQGLSATNKSKISSLDTEILDIFKIQLS